MDTDPRHRPTLALPPDGTLPPVSTGAALRLTHNRPTLSLPTNADLALDPVAPPPPAPPTGNPTLKALGDYLYQNGWQLGRQYGLPAGLKIAGRWVPGAGPLGGVTWWGQMAYASGSSAVNRSMGWDPEFHAEMVRAQNHGNIPGQLALHSEVAMDYTFAAFATNEALPVLTKTVQYGGRWAPALSRFNLVPGGMAGRAMASFRTGMGGPLVLMAVPAATIASGYYNDDQTKAADGVASASSTTVGMIIGGGVGALVCPATAGAATVGTDGAAAPSFLLVPPCEMGFATMGGVGGQFISPILRLMPGPVQRWSDRAGAAIVAHHQRSEEEDILNKEITALLPALNKMPQWVKDLDNGSLGDMPIMSMSQLDSGTVPAYARPDGKASMSEVVDKLKASGVYEDALKRDHALTIGDLTKYLTTAKHKDPQVFAAH
ncbi:MAG: hypothetical protein WDN72_04260 [Alphaproteobacteria bacterium]